MNNRWDQYYARLREKSEREDLVMFVNACFAATNQNEYYTDRYEQTVSIEFLHRYVMANYRRVYARVIAAGINHFSQALIVSNLLKSGAPQEQTERAEVGELIAAAMRQLPANRAYGLIRSLQRARVNNRRTRAVIKRYLAWRKEPEFDAVKYRNKYRAAAEHAHMSLGDQLQRFLFELNKRKQQRFEIPLLEQYRAAHYSASAIYELPFSIAESLAEKHSVPRDVFLRKIEPKMTAAEKLRMQSSAARAGNTRFDFDLRSASVTRLALYALSLTAQQRESRTRELHEALTASAERQRVRTTLRLGRVAAVLDRSRSSCGSRQKRNRPLAVAIASGYLLRALSSEYREFWTPPLEQAAAPLTARASGQTCLAEPLLDALQWQPDLVVIVSDGYENDPPRAADQVARVYLDRIAGRSSSHRPQIIHANPVFDAEHYSPRTLGASIATVGLRDAEDITTMLGFARFASGQASLAELEDYLAGHAERLLHGGQR